MGVVASPSCDPDHRNKLRSWPVWAIMVVTVKFTEASGMKKRKKSSRRNPLWKLVLGQAEAALKPKVERGGKHYNRKQDGRAWKRDLQAA